MFQKPDRVTLGWAVPCDYYFFIIICSAIKFLLNLSMLKFVQKRSKRQTFVSEVVVRVSCWINVYFAVMVISIAGKLDGHLALRDTSTAKECWFPCEQILSLCFMCATTVRIVSQSFSQRLTSWHKTQGGLHARNLMVTSFFLSRLDGHKQHLPLWRHCTLVGLKMLSAKYFKGLLWKSMAFFWCDLISK